MIVDQHGNPVSSASRHFAVAADRSDRSLPPQSFFKDDIEKLIPKRDLDELISRSRQIFQNYGPIAGALQQKADNAVGRAWSPKFMGEDREWGAKAKDWIENQWYDFCDVRGRNWDFKTLLWLDSVALDRDGDFLTILTEAESGFPLTQRIPANRIGIRGNPEKVPEGKPYAGSKCSHGIIRDRLNRPLAYSVLGDTAEDDRIIPANQAVHLFDPLWHDQVRGIPALSHAIKQVFASFTATEREQLNQLIRSSISLIEYNDSGAPSDDPSDSFGGSGPTADQSPAIQQFAGGMIKYFKSNSGGKLESLNNDSPGDIWDRFQDRVIRLALSGYNWPFELVWKANEINAALVRNIQERARKSVEDRQDVLRKHAVYVLRYAVAKAIKIGILDKPKNVADWWKWDFQMPAKFSVDKGKDAQQRRNDHAAGLINFDQIIEEEGGDPEVVLKNRIDFVVRRARAIKEARDANPDLILDQREFFMLTPNDPPPAAPTAAEEDPDQEPDEDSKDKEEE